AWAGGGDPVGACRSPPASSYTGPAGGTGTAATTTPAVTWTASRPDRPVRRTGSAKSKTIKKRGPIMGSTEAPPLTVVQPGGGAHGDLGTIGVVFKLWGRDTGGALAIVEHPFPVGALVTPHTHTREDEYSIVTEGQIGFRSGDREAVLGPGRDITKPPGELHPTWNAGPLPARMIEAISPARVEHVFRELAYH